MCSLQRRHSSVKRKASPKLHLGNHLGRAPQRLSQPLTFFFGEHHQDRLRTLQNPCNRPCNFRKRFPNKDTNALSAWFRFPALPRVLMPRRNKISLTSASVADSTFRGTRNFANRHAQYRYVSSVRHDRCMDRKFAAPARSVSNHPTEWARRAHLAATHVCKSWSWLHLCALTTPESCGYWCPQCCRCAVNEC